MTLAKISVQKNPHFFHSFEGKIFKGRLIARDETQQQVVCMFFNQLIIFFFNLLFTDLHIQERNYSLIPALMKIDQEFTILEMLQ